MINIVCNIDRVYITHCKVMLSSLFENNKDISFCIHILGYNLGEDDKKDIESFVLGKYKNQIKFYNVKEQDLLVDKKCESEHISLAANIRLSLASILPKDLEKVLYLDCDMIILDSLKPIIDTDIEDVAVAVVEDMYSAKEDIYTRLQYDKSYSYFNSGLLWINLEYWRKNNIENQIVSCFHKHSDNLTLVDQDILNAALYNKKIFLPLRFNLQTGFYRQTPHYREKLSKQVDKALLNPAVIHFTSRKKPWVFNCLHPCRKVYGEYYKIAFGEKLIIKKRKLRYFCILSYKLSLQLKLVNGYKDIDKIRIPQFN